MAVDLTSSERRLLAAMLEQFRQLLFSGSDPHLACLEPPACLEDPVTELEYRAMAANQLLKRRLEAIETVENGLSGIKLDAEMIAAWMQTLNGMRLYLSERLELHSDRRRSHMRITTKDESTPDRSENQQPSGGLIVSYQWLSEVLEQLVEAAAEDFPDLHG